MPRVVLCEERDMPASAKDARQLPTASATETVHLRANAMILATRPLHSMYAVLCRIPCSSVTLLVHGARRRLGSFVLQTGPLL
jgi:hypothetical protein